MANHHTRQVPALSADQREELQRWLRRGKTSQALASRARIVLACAEGGSDLAVARDLGTTRGPSANGGAASCRTAVTGCWTRHVPAHRGASGMTTLSGW